MIYPFSLPLLASIPLLTDQASYESNALSDMPFLCRLTQELASMGIGVRYELG